MIPTRALGVTKETEIDKPEEIASVLIKYVYANTINRIQLQGIRIIGSKIDWIERNITCSSSLFSDTLQLRQWHIREQGWRSGESARLQPMYRRFDSRTWRHVWVEFAVGSLFYYERFFSGYSGFPLSLKTNISKFQFDLGMHGNFLNEFLWTPWCSAGE